MFFLDEVRPRIFCVTFHDHYRLSEVFLRPQEAYEGVSVNQTDITIDQIKREYIQSSQKDLIYTYAEDWGGFNLTGEDIRITLQNSIKDYNQNDTILSAIFGLCSARYPDQKFSLLGLSRDSSTGLVDVDTFNHEMAHAFYAQDEDYANEMDNLSNSMSNNIQEILLQLLASWGYTNNVWFDEIQAYMATNYNYYEEFRIIEQLYPTIKKYSKQYSDIFNSYFESDFQIRNIIST